MFRTLSAYEELFEKAHRLMIPWGLWESRDLLVRHLSYGKQRCVDLVMCLASMPKLVLLDEPTSGMTPAEVAKMSEMIKTIGKDTTIIIIAHDLDLIFGLDLDCITVLHYGQIIAEGSPRDIKIDPKVREIYLGTT
jgi:branched-chain amino acid transport system ATP-binding protein